MGALKRTFRWIAVSTVGFTLVVLGVVLLFLPGPGLLAIVAGLAVLSLEFLWAERLRHRATARLRAARAAHRRRRRTIPLHGYASDRDREGTSRDRGSTDRTGSDAA